MPRLPRQKSKDKKDLEKDAEEPKSNSNSKPKPSKCSKEKADRWVVLMNDEIVSAGKESTDDEVKESQPTLCQLRHPRMNKGILYLISAKWDSIYEMQCFQEKFRSWFIGDTVHSRGDLYITTPVDPVFLVLPYLINAGQKFMSLDQLVCDEEFPECQKLVNCVENDQLDLVADCKDIDDDLRVCRYNSEKTLAWLKAKAESLADALEHSKTNVSAKGSQSAIFVRSKNTETPKEAYMSFAVGMLADYIPLKLESELKAFLGISEKENATSPTEARENEPPNKKAKVEAEDDSGPIDDYSQKVDMKLLKAKPSKQSKAQKQLDKVDKSGMKSMTSFFSPKTKS